MASQESTLVVELEPAQAVAEQETTNADQPAPAPAARKPRNPRAHPSYEEMIKDAIVTLKDRTGSSQYAIAKFMEGKHKQLPLNFRKRLLNHLKKLVASGKLVKVKASFKLPPLKPSATKPSAVAGAKKRKPTSAKPRPRPRPKPEPEPEPIRHGPPYPRMRTIQEVARALAVAQAQARAKVAQAHAKARAEGRAKAYLARKLKAAKADDEAKLVTAVPKTKPASRPKPKERPAPAKASSPRKKAPAPKLGPTKAAPVKKGPAESVKSPAKMGRE